MFFFQATGRHRKGYGEENGASEDGECKRHKEGDQREGTHGEFGKGEISSGMKGSSFTGRGVLMQKASDHPSLGIWGLNMHTDAPKKYKVTI